MAVQCPADQLQHVPMLGLLTARTNRHMSKVLSVCVPCRTQISCSLTHHPLWRGTETSHGPTRQVGIPLSFLLEMGNVCLYIASEARVTQLLASGWQACEPLLQHGAVCSGLLSCKACLGKLAVTTSLQPEGRQHV